MFTFEEYKAEHLLL